MAAAVPFFITETSKELDRLNGMSRNEINTAYADLCTRREAKRIFKNAVKTMTAQSDPTLTITVDPDSDAVQTCPPKIHAARVSQINLAQQSNWGVGVTCVLMGLGAGYLTLGYGKKQGPKP